MVASDHELRRASIEGIEAAARALAPYQPATPLVRSELISKALGADVWLKLETVSPIGSFKIRGALTALLRASEGGNVTRTATASTGNHGQGLAYAARLLRVPCEVFVPNGINPVKREMMITLGASVREGGQDLEEAKALGLAGASDVGALFVDDGESLDVMEGAGTVALEIVKALPEVQWIFIPTGSGTLAGGCATVARARRQAIRTVIVQSSRAPAMVDSFRARRAVRRPATTLAEGLVCAEPARLALDALLNLVDDGVLVEEHDLLAAVRVLVEQGRVLAEPSGAAALAAAWQMRKHLKGQRVVLIITGANVRLDVLTRALATPPLFEA